MTSIARCVVDAATGCLLGIETQFGVGLAPFSIAGSEPSQQQDAQKKVDA
jgi:hypothetical protein